MISIEKIRRACSIIFYEDTWDIHQYVVFSSILSLQIFRAKELLDNTLAFIKNVMSGAIIDPDRLVIGTEEGLFCLDLDRSGKLNQGLKQQRYTW